MDKREAFLVAVKVNEENLLELGRRYKLSPQGNTVGNTPDADIVINFNSEVPCVLRLYEEEDHWYLLDVTEQSFIHKNNLLVQESQISDRDIITIGPFGFEFCSGSGLKAHYFEQIETLLQEDFLTRAYNRGFLFNLLDLEVGRYNRRLTESQKELNPSNPSRLSLIFIDVDDFGVLNKQYGHHVGDEILRSVVKRIKDQSRVTDIIARYGGEEFCIVLLDTSREQAVSVAENIRKLIADEPFKIDEKRSLPITLSGGIAELEHGMNTDSFVKAADDKMRKAKKQGKNLIIA